MRKTTAEHVIESFKTSIWALEKKMRVLKLSMTFESGLLPIRHFLEANTTHSFYIAPLVEMLLRRGAPAVYFHHTGANYTVGNPPPRGNPGLKSTLMDTIVKKFN
jgi:hypothetical protein